LLSKSVGASYKKSEVVIESDFGDDDLDTFSDSDSKESKDSVSDEMVA
jgi:hypothetical protein